jgi:hypothetical protein
MNAEERRNVIDHLAAQHDELVRVGRAIEDWKPVLGRSLADDERPAELEEVTMQLHGAIWSLTYLMRVLDGEPEITQTDLMRELDGKPVFSLLRNILGEIADKLGPKFMRQLNDELVSE